MNEMLPVAAGAEQAGNLRLSLLALDLN